MQAYDEIDGELITVSLRAFDEGRLVCAQKAYDAAYKTIFVGELVVGGKALVDNIDDVAKFFRKLFSNGDQLAQNGADDFVNLAGDARTSHILDGEVRPNGAFGGGHRGGTGYPGKSEFPTSWSDDQIMYHISDVATDPSLTWRPGNRPGDFWVNGTPKRR